MPRFHVFLRGLERRKVTTVEAKSVDEGVGRVAAIRGLDRHELFGIEVRARALAKCPSCGYERMVRKLPADWRPRECSACDAQSRGEIHAAAARKFFEKASRIRAARKQ